MTSFRPGAALLLLALFSAACGEQTRTEDGTAAAAEAPQPEVIDLARLGHSRGAADAPVTVVEFSDFGCPYCARFALETLPQLEEEFISTGKVRWQYVPFVLGMFPNGEGAARTAECAAEQEQFWPMHDLLYERQREWKSSGDADPLFLSYANGLGLDEARFASCYREDRPASSIEVNNQVAAKLGVTGTPSFLINGRPVQGALPIEQFRMLLEWAGAPAQ